MIEFRLPVVPPSMNSLYNVVFALKRVELKSDVRRYKSDMKVYVPPFEVGKNQPVAMDIYVVQDWFFKNGNMKKQDIQNMVKVIVDLIAEKQGWDDSQVTSITAHKLQSDKRQYVLVKEILLTKVMEDLNGCKIKG